jgi:hypothetical protein
MVIAAGQPCISPNVNCLEGKRCPGCGSYGPFEVLVSMRVMLHDSGTRDAKDGSVWYDDKAPAKCDACGYAGKFCNFDEKPE